MLFSYVAILSFLPITNAFTSTTSRTFVSNRVLYALDSKYFQLEELEDAESATTELFLEKDGSVIAGETDGPPPTATSGTWEQNDEKFEMKLKRSFNSGYEGTDMGVFSFELERRFEGILTKVGENTAVAGTMHIMEEELDVNVGFFNMIDTKRDPDEIRGRLSTS